MHVVWKRPDGFHGADPADFVVVNVGTRAKIWLHRTDQSHFPFRIAGGWQEAESSTRLNQLVNLLTRDDPAWIEALVKIYDDTMGDDPGRYLDDLTRWVNDLCHHLKGDTWELDIMTHTLTEVANRLGSVRGDFYQGSTRPRLSPTTRRAQFIDHIKLAYFSVLGPSWY